MEHAGGELAGGLAVILHGGVEVGGLVGIEVGVALLHFVVVRHDEAAGGGLEKAGARDGLGDGGAEDQVLGGVVAEVEAGQDVGVVLGEAGGTDDLGVVVVGEAAGLEIGVLEAGAD